jgi:hypothetical protein
MSALIDLTNKSFGAWTVICRGPTTTHIQWWCQCMRCGTIHLVLGMHLRRGSSRSCGCANRDRMRQGLLRNFIHGMTGTTEYTIWLHMKQRCLNPKAPDYHNYGGRGITICPRWQDSFEAFFADMGPRPSPQYTMERVRNMDGYSPDNCVWGTAVDQGRNRRTNHMLTLHGDTLCITEWAHRTGIHKATLRSRKLRQWSDEEALTTPVRGHNTLSL